MSPRWSYAACSVFRRIVGVLALAGVLLTVGRASADPEPAHADAPAASGVEHAGRRPEAPSWLAQPVQPGAGARPDAPPSSHRSVLALLAVAAIGGGAYYMKRKRNARPALPASARLHLVESVRVSPHAQVVLTSVNGRLLLLGVTDRAVHRIAWVGRTQEAPKWVPEGTLGESEPPTKDAANPAPREPTGALHPFRAMLDALNSDRAARIAEAPAVQIAGETRDTYEPSAARNALALTTLRSIETAAAASAPIEGQATGLRKRAKRPT